MSSLKNLFADEIKKSDYEIGHFVVKFKEYTNHFFKINLLQ